MSRALACLFVAVVALAQQAAPPKLEKPPAPPAQPIPYSHKQHLAMGLKCSECHTMEFPGEMMGLPATSKCMTCHQAVKKDSPAIQQLASYAAQKQPVPWVRVYQIPSFVEFSHKLHLGAGSTCETCHGDVPQKERMFRETDISMGGCVTCHRQAKVSTDCALCHELRR